MKEQIKIFLKRIFPKTPQRDFQSRGYMPGYNKFNLKPLPFPWAFPIIYVERHLTDTGSQFWVLYTGTYTDDFFHSEYEKSDP